MSLIKHAEATFSQHQEGVNVKYDYEMERVFEEYADSSSDSEEDKLNQSRRSRSRSRNRRSKHD